ncbi:hypothetical protein [Paenibacillus sp. GP183]|uniref:hypothetical protein n=1 Tax=Paenibacillus sp. GP183 TaxID=1882751 RepID=UPI000899B692|nr:hypothetical protein [Paenibacillus sp. GP183]SEB87640.1 hypothetical protein SAMN05443246_2210 [Paenibacillus sp. GP183]
MNKVLITTVLTLFVILGCSITPKSDDKQMLREYHGGPAVSTEGSVISIIELKQSEVTKESSIEANVKLKANGKIKINGTPQLRVYKFGQANGEEPLMVHNIDHWKQLPLGDNATVEEKVTLTAPSDPGYYRVELSLDSYVSNSTNFFVKYPTDTLYSGTFPVNLKVEALGRILKIDSITMTSKSATVSFSLSPGVRGFATELVTDNGKKLVGISSIPFDEKTIVQATATFEPIPISVKSVKFTLSNIQLMTNVGIVDRPGSWEVVIPLEQGHKSS